MIRETIYVASNRPEANSIVAFTADNNGKLKKVGEFNTGGKGTGNIEIFDWGYDVTHPLKDGIDPLISAYGIFKTSDNKNILVVNSGDGTISSMRIMENKSLIVSDIKPTSDAHPLSIASHNRLVYVASAGDRIENPSAPPFTGSITGYTIDESGKLRPINNSTRDLKARPSCIAFTPDGKFVVVNELVTGFVKVFGVNSDGTLSKEPISMKACPHEVKNGRWLAIPVGFDIVQKGNSYVVLVSEARFLNNKGMLREEKNRVPQSPLYSWQTGSTSSFIINSSGKINLVSGDVMTGKNMEGGQIANCWVEASHDGNILWAANALSSSISSYAINSTGEITLRNEVAYKEPSEKLFFSDLHLGKNGKYLYQLIGNMGEIKVFETQSNGNLKSIGQYAGLPQVGAYGVIVVY